jgi:hypothetical protein
MSLESSSPRTKVTRRFVSAKATTPKQGPTVMEPIVTWIGDRVKSFAGPKRDLSGTYVTSMFYLSHSCLFVTFMMLYHFNFAFSQLCIK